MEHECIIAPMITPEYEQALMAWRASREKSIRRENGWLALAGLFWLNEGWNRIGSEPGSDILLPDRLPASVGSIHLEGKDTVLTVEPGVAVKVNGEAVTQVTLKPDRDETPSFITLDGVRMVLIDRPAGMGLRLWDNEREERRLFPPRQWYPTNEALRLPARYEVHSEPRKVLLPDVFGELLESQMEGQVTFELDGKTHTLQATRDEDGHLDLNFADLTNGKGTYPSGRYYYSAEPVPVGDFILDFNYAYSPPCAFTPYATCAFAPAENRLPIPIEAGEIYPAHE